VYVLPSVFSRFRMSAMIAFRSLLNREANFRRVARISSFMESIDILDFQEFVWCTNHRWSISAALTYPFNPSSRIWIDDMLEVPGH
jgi:hypothetical protein